MSRSPDTGIQLRTSTELSTHAFQLPEHDHSLRAPEELTFVEKNALDRVGDDIMDTLALHIGISLENATVIFELLESLDQDITDHSRRYQTQDAQTNEKEYELIASQVRSLAQEVATMIVNQPEWEVTKISSNLNARITIENKNTHTEIHFTERGFLLTSPTVEVSWNEFPGPDSGQSRTKGITDRYITAHQLGETLGLPGPNLRINAGGITVTEILCSPESRRGQKRDEAHWMEFENSSRVFYDRHGTARYLQVARPIVSPNTSNTTHYLTYDLATLEKREGKFAFQTVPDTQPHLENPVQPFSLPDPELEIRDEWVNVTLQDGTVDSFPRTIQPVPELAQNMLHHIQDLFPPAPTPPELEKPPEKLEQPAQYRMHPEVEARLQELYHPAVALVWEHLGIPAATGRQLQLQLAEINAKLEALPTRETGKKDSPERQAALSAINELQRQLSQELTTFLPTRIVEVMENGLDECAVVIGLEEDSPQILFTADGFTVYNYEFAIKWIAPEELPERLPGNTAFQKSVDLRFAQHTGIFSELPYNEIQISSRPGIFSEYFAPCPMVLIQSDETHQDDEALWETLDLIKPRRFLTKAVYDETGKLTHLQAAYPDMSSANPRSFSSDIRVYYDFRTQPPTTGVRPSLRRKGSSWDYTSQLFTPEITATDAAIQVRLVDNQEANYVDSIYVPEESFPLHIESVEEVANKMLEILKKRLTPPKMLPESTSPHQS